MARITDEELARLKREVPLVHLVEARGAKLSRVGKDLRGRCPFHSPDDDPSFSVDPARNVFHCFGCGAKGTVVDFVMKAEGVSFRHAVEILRTNQGTGVRDQGSGGRGQEAGEGTPPPVVKVSTVQKLPTRLDLDADGQEQLDQVAGYYHETLLESPEALEYLASRGLDHPELVEHFRLGFANRTLGYRLPNKQRVAGAEIRGRLAELGILRDSGHEHFNGCVVFPTLAEAGHVVGLYGRKITRQLKKGLATHLYLRGPRRGVFNLAGLEGAEEVILCESHIDALTFWCAGFRAMTTAWGAGGFTEEHFQAFRRLGVERVLIAYDRDDAGDKGAREVAATLEEAGIAAYRVLFPRGMDANEYALKVAPAAKSLGLVLRNAIPLGSGALPVSRDPLPAGEEEDGSWESGVGREEPEDPKLPAEERAAPPLASSSSPSSPSSPTPPTASHAPPTTSLPARATGNAQRATTLPQIPKAPTVPAVVNDHEVVITLGDRRYRVRGLERNMSYDQLRINLLAGRGAGFHVDTLELYSARQRAAFAKPAAEEMKVDEDIVKADLGKVLMKLEELQEEQIKKTLEPEEKAVVLSAEEREAALDLLRDPLLVERILEGFARCGVVGEETNKLVGYLAAVSRKLAEPLAVVIQSSSAAGKSSLMEAILALVPEEERVQYSAMTGQSLFYMGEHDLAHKILAIVEEEGAERASYALKLLQSEGELTIASTGKDPTSGRLVTHEYRVEGPVAIFLTTTAIEVDEELLNRCLVLTVDEDREQTRAIHRRQRQAQTLAGLLAKEEREEVVTLHRNAQRLLQPLRVANPYAERLTFLDARTRTRRDHLKYLTMIRAIALLFQHQRPLRTVTHRGRPLHYIEVQLADIELANRLAHEVLGRSLDELSPQTRRLLLFLDEIVTREGERLQVDRVDLRFTRRDVREAIGWTDFQVRTHLDKLVSLEYVLVHRGGRGQSFVYELLYDGQGKEGEPFLPGLLEIEKLRCEPTGRSSTSRGPEPTSRGGKSDPEGPSSIQRAPIEPPTRSGEGPSEPSKEKGLLRFEGKSPEKALEGVEEETEVVTAVRGRTRAAAAGGGEGDER